LVAREAKAAAQGKTAVKAKAAKGKLKPARERRA
jgi:hypothetical protein